ncbi:MAG: cell division protein ZipA C-terminal FtsZ-binding domain-containing protein [Burkholderiales bacterium]
MSDLQLSLLVIGAVVIGAVCLYNWLQERSLQRRLQQAFGSAHDDVLLKAGLESARAYGRLEPQLVPAEPPRAREAAAGGAAAAPVAAGFDALLDYVAEINSATPIADALIGELSSKIASCGKPTRMTGFEPRGSTWMDAARGDGGRYTRLRLGLQLANRAGAVNPAQLATFCDAVRQCADKIPAEAVCPDPQASLKVGRELDAFCAQVDVAIGVNVIAPEGGTFAGTRIRALAESAGFKLEPDGVFRFRNELRQTLFTLDNHEPAPFLPESIKGISTHGITLLLDVPRVAHGIEALEQMLKIASGLAAGLGGRVVDDNRAALSEAGMARIREQLRSIHAAMAQHNVPAGGARALRLFS